MSRLENGKWVEKPLLAHTDDGAYRRQEQQFRDSIHPGGKFSPAPGRYHLYVSYACPWAHRTLIFRKLKRLENVVSLSVTSPDMLSDGWTFRPDFPGVVPDSVLGKEFLHEVYTTAAPRFTGEVTVPVLFDREEKAIVNNESSEIIRIFNSAFNELTGHHEDFYPEALREEIDAVNAEIYDHLNNGVYRAGFARQQEAYEKSVRDVFACLERLEKRLSGRQYLVGERLTEADVRLYTTLVRFDPVYHGHFKCNLRMLREYSNLKRYLAFLYRIPAFRETTHFNHIQRHYYYSHEQLNPSQIVPKGPDPFLVE